MRTRNVPPTAVPDPDRKPVRRRPAQGKGHGLLTAAPTSQGQEGTAKGAQTCDAKHDQTHGLLTAAHNKEKRP